MRIVHDVRYAARALRRSPAFAIATVLVLAIGIGANTAVFSVARGVLLRTLPYPEPDRLVQFVSHLQTGRAALASVPKYRAWRAGIAGEVFEAMTAYHAGAGVTLVAGDRKVHLDALYVTADYFDVFGAPVDLGRVFTRAEDVPQGPRVVVISRALAVREYGVGENPVGKVISLGGVPHEIVGVIGAGFRSMPDADIWLPLQAPRVSFNHTNYLTVVARLRHGVSVRRASLQAARITDAFRQKFPLAMAPWEEFGAEPFAEMVAGDTGPALRMLVGAVSFVLLIACANAANLLVARATRRRADIATRAALGASRLRLVRQLFAECLLLSFAGGTLGLAAGYLGVRALLAATPGALPRLPDVAPDASILLFTLAATVVTAILFGLLPILGASRVDLSTALKDSASDGATAARRHGGQAALVVIEMTLAIVLLVGAGLMLRTFMSLRTVDRGFDPADVLTLEMPLTDGRFDTADRVTALVQDVERRLRDLPAVKTTAASFALPLQPTLALPFTLLDRPLLGATYHGVGNWLNVSPAYFDALRIRLYRGRMFDIHDDAGAQPVAIISLTMARRFWQNNDPLGQKVLVGKSADHEFDEPPRTIVGIVNDVRDGGAAPEPRLYVPIAQTTDRLTARNNRYLQPDVDRARQRGRRLVADRDRRRAPRGERRPAACARAADVGHRPGSDGGTRVHDGAPHGVCRLRARPRGDRAVRTHGVLGSAADQGDRHSHGARRRARCAAQHGARGRRPADGRRYRDRPGGSADRVKGDGESRVRHRNVGPRGLRRRRWPARRSRARRGVCARSARDAREPAHGASTLTITEEKERRGGLNHTGEGRKGESRWDTWGKARSTTREGDERGRSGYVNYTGRQRDNAARHAADGHAKVQLSHKCRVV